MAALRLAREEDIPVVARLFDQARQALAAAGVDQWQDGYPNGEDVRRDVAAGDGYVIVENHRVVAYACLSFGHEPTYDVIANGSWLGRGEYGFLHRAAVDPDAKGRGLAGELFEELKRQARARGMQAVRGDTHRDNQPMQRVMAKAGLAYRGVITLTDGSERLAFEALLTE